jgi:alkylation response protein AidB-like acyl-CoA dehydrogenase
LRELFERARAARLTRHQHVLFRLGDLAMQAETAAVFCRAVVEGGDARYAVPARRAMARIYARDCALQVATEAIRWLRGCDLKDDPAALEKALKLPQIHEAQAGLMADLDGVAAALTGREASPSERMAN